MLNTYLHYPNDMMTSRSSSTTQRNIMVILAVCNPVKSRALSAKWRFVAVPHIDLVTSCQCFKWILSATSSRIYHTQTMNCIGEVCICSVPFNLKLSSCCCCWSLLSLYNYCTIILYPHSDEVAVSSFGCWICAIIILYELHNKLIMEDKPYN